MIINIKIITITIIIVRLCDIFALLLDNRLREWYNYPTKISLEDVENEKDNFYFIGSAYCFYTFVLWK